MNEDCLKLTAYLGERQRSREGFLADALSDLYARHGLAVSLLMRGVEGFGLRQHLRTDRLLSLSEDLPLVSAAVDARERIEAALRDLAGLGLQGLVTLERARMLTGPVERAPLLPWASPMASKLTVYVGRGERAAGGPAYRVVAELLHRRGLAGACALLGVDGTVHGARRRARLLSTNAEVPMMLIGLGETGPVCDLLPELSALLSRPLMTLERVQLCKRGGTLFEPPHPVLGSDATGLGVWQKLMVLSQEQDRVDGEPLHQRLIRELRRRGAAGATVLRGVWGFRDPGAPRGDSLWQLRRNVPLLTVIVDAPERIARWFETVDSLTTSAGTVSCELVPAYRASTGTTRHGGLRLAQL